MWPPTRCRSRLLPALASERPFEGTLIRIPFRTQATAESSEISEIVVDAAMGQTLRQQFDAEAYQWLLFLRNVREVTMSELRDTDEEHLSRAPPPPECVALGLFLAVRVCFWSASAPFFLVCVCAPFTNKKTHISRAWSCGGPGVAW